MGIERFFVWDGLLTSLIFNIRLLIIQRSLPNSSVDHPVLDSLSTDPVDITIP